MLRRHANDLAESLENVAYRGWCIIPRWKLTRWYTQDRFSVNIRRDLRERWDELSGELTFIADTTLKIGEVGDDILLVKATDEIFWEDDE
ncbi:hypothetical protein Alvin_3221 (plasmid) [Allochromatium vinosum DSM 180]|uniref:Uncharacterized protein n=1 Tax=Allochromatium vinosum (strain ATCC 17899 / DSM 180 / NBRC 103801 / NCIMB 10441 / D) TaxID=572477 RepID=D3RWA4_ALLVD|nr:hypothetical protein Alvin_3221 [Allochromatium vinosum DSM 180]